MPKDKLVSLLLGVVSYFKILIRNALYFYGLLVCLNPIVDVKRAIVSVFIISARDCFMSKIILIFKS